MKTLLWVVMLGLFIIAEKYLTPWSILLIAGGNIVGYAQARVHQNS